MQELKTCPFCRGEAELRDDNGSEYPYTVECVECGATTSQHRHADTPYGAIEAWNTRAVEVCEIVGFADAEPLPIIPERTCRLICHEVELPDGLKEKGVEMRVYECDECGERMFSDYNYCPACGAKVVS